MKTDNHNLPAKLKLRRYFLQRYHAGTRPQVLDCCQGGGRIWTSLARDFEVDCWGLDLKPKKGRLRLDSIRVLAQSGWTQDVIDIDTYGSPWKHWRAMLPNVKKPTTVFLTYGTAGPNQVHLGREELDAIGITFDRVRKMSGAITHRLLPLAIPYCLSAASRHGLRIVEAQEAISDGNARYFGLRLEPAAQSLIQTPNTASASN